LGGAKVDRIQTSEESNGLPAWLAESWSTVIRLLALTLVHQPPATRDAILRAIDNGDVRNLEYYADDERRKLILGFHDTALCEIDYDAVIGIRTPSGRTH
jgi:hypothetical protein